MAEYDEKVIKHVMVFIKNQMRRNESRKEGKFTRDEIIENVRESLENEISIFNNILKSRGNIKKIKDDYDIDMLSLEILNDKSFINKIMDEIENAGHNDKDIKIDKKSDEVNVTEDTEKDTNAKKNKFKEELKFTPMKNGKFLDDPELKFDPMIKGKTLNELKGESR